MTIQNSYGIFNGYGVEAPAIEPRCVFLSSAGNLAPFQRWPDRAVSLYVALRRFSYRKVREVPEWGRGARAMAPDDAVGFDSAEFSRKIVQLGLAHSAAGDA